MPEIIEMSPPIRVKPSSYRSYLWGFSTALVLTLALFIVNAVLTDTFMESSIRVSIALQTAVNLKVISFIFSYVIFFILFAYVFLLYTIRKDIERNLVMILSLAMLIYMQAILKLLYVNPRPIFLSSEIDSANCTCDYGQPSGHALSSIGLCLLIFDDIRKYYKPRFIWQVVICSLLVLLSLLICFSRLYFGVHSYNQLILGLGFGVCIFFLIKILADPLKDHIFGPIWNTGKYANPWLVVKAALLFLSTNILLFVLWAIRHWAYENPITSRINFVNCFDCLANPETKFATKIIAEGLIYNVLFGMLIGIRVMSAPIYEYTGLYFDSKFWQYLLRLLIMALFASPAVLIKFPKSQIVAVEIIRTLLISLLVGYLITHPFVVVLLKLTNREEVSISAERIGVSNAYNSERLNMISNQNLAVKPEDSQQNRMVFEEQHQEGTFN